MQHNILPTNILEWLLNRGITQEAITRFEIGWNGREIVIPVYDKDHTLLFNKYRRDPFSTDDTIPKYKYDKGASVVLYNQATLNTIKPDELLFIVEGELDCICLESKGIKCVSTTGGSKSFQGEWSYMFNDLQNVIICYDNDEAGIMGAIRTQSFLPKAQMLVLPLGGGKDVTEYLSTHSLQDFVALKSHQYPIPADVSDTRNPQQLKDKVAQFRYAAEALKLSRRDWVRDRKNSYHIDLMLNYCINRYETYRRAENNLKRRPYTGSGETVAEAKQVPITNFIQFNHAGYAPCLWHNEKTASMYYNKENTKFPNTVKCFGCGAMGDAVDVVMQLHGKEFKDAVNFLLGKDKSVDN